MTLDYRHPTTPMRPRVDLRNPLYPLALCAACAGVGLLSPTRSGTAELSGLLLLPLACWYVVARIYRDGNVRLVWRPCLATIAAGCVLLTAWTTQVDHGLPLYWEHWCVYNRVRPELFPLASGLACFGLLRASAWYRQRARK